MLRFGTRLITVDREILKRKYFLNADISFAFVKITQPTAQVTTLSKTEPYTKELSSQIISLANSVQELGLNEIDIKFAVQKQPDILKKTPSVWNDILGTLLNYGITKKQMLSILGKWPQILSLKKSELKNNLDVWFRCDLGDDVTTNVLVSYPQLLEVDHSSIEKRIRQYVIYFESKKRVGKVLLSAPNTLIEDSDEILDKLNYLDSLCIEKHEIASTGVLAHSAQHVRARHEFLIRAGIYKKPGKEFNRKLCKNPKLDKIVNSSDKEFVFEVAQLSLLEYEVFLEMFDEEFKESKNQELDSDDEEELHKRLYNKKYCKKSKI